MNETIDNTVTKEDVSERLISSRKLALKNFETLSIHSELTEQVEKDLVSSKQTVSEFDIKDQVFQWF